MFMSSFHGPARVTSLEWKLCHMSLILKDDWQILGCFICFFFVDFSERGRILFWRRKIRGRVSSTNEKQRNEFETWCFNELKKRNKKLMKISYSVFYSFYLWRLLARGQFHETFYTRLFRTKVLRKSFFVLEVKVTLIIGARKLAQMCS